mmetsp:Transcript_10282/g.18794  ORF Transcript_10282/g.18794 Transcript_10282/m.18794 type:complete len:211 (-) Transcript_10282:349-981(-)
MSRLATAPATSLRRLSPWSLLGALSTSCLAVYTCVRASRAAAWPCLSPAAWKRARASWAASNASVSSPLASRTSASFCSIQASSHMSPSSRMMARDCSASASASPAAPQSNMASTAAEASSIWPRLSSSLLSSRIRSLTTVRASSRRPRWQRAFTAVERAVASPLTFPNSCQMSIASSAIFCASFASSGKEASAMLPSIMASCLLQPRSR